MAFDKDAFLTALDGMSVMELNDLVKAIEEKFGVSANAPVAVAAAGAGARAGGGTGGTTAAGCCAAAPFVVSVAMGAAAPGICIVMGCFSYRS